MSNTVIRKQIILNTTICIVYLLLTIFYHHIDKYLTGFIFIILTLLIPLTFIAIVIYSIKGLIQLFRNRRYLTFTRCLPTTIVVITLLYTLVSPYQLNSEDLESDTSFRACYEGTQNQSYIKFKVDNTFEIHSTGVFFASFWYLGQWRKNGDTLFLKFDNEKPRLLGDTIIINKDYLIPIFEMRNDSLINYHRFYYLGYCKGLN